MVHGFAQQTRVYNLVPEVDRTRPVPDENQVVPVGRDQRFHRIGTAGGTVYQHNVGLCLAQRSCFGLRPNLSNRQELHGELGVLRETLQLVLDPPALLFRVTFGNYTAPRSPAGGLPPAGDRVDKRWLYRQLFLGERRLDASAHLPALVRLGSQGATAQSRTSHTCKKTPSAHTALCCAMENRVLSHRSFSSLVTGASGAHIVGLDCGRLDGSQPDNPS